MAIIIWNAEEKSWCNKELILWKKVHYSTIWGQFCYKLSQWKCIWLYQKEKLISKFHWPKTTWLYNLGHHEKDTLQELKKRYEEIECLSESLSYAWDKLTKKLINISIELWLIRLEKVVEDGGSHIVRLLWQPWIMIQRTFR